MNSIDMLHHYDRTVAAFVAAHPSPRATLDFDAMFLAFLAAKLSFRDGGGELWYAALNNAANYCTAESEYLEKWTTP